MINSTTGTTSEASWSTVYGTARLSNAALLGPVASVSTTTHVSDS